MDVIEAIRRRRAVVEYQDRPIPDDVLRQVVEGGYLAPTGGNRRSREFVVTEDRTRLGQLAAVQEYGKWLAGTRAAIALLGIPGNSRYWVEDCGVAGAQIWLAAVELGLGAGWAAMYLSDDPKESARREQLCREILGIPESLRVVGVIGLGYPASVPPAKAKPAMSEIVHWGRFGEHKR